MEQSKVQRIGSYEYKETEKLGQGAYGTVFRGRRVSRSSTCSSISGISDDAPLDVALKRVPSGMLRDTEVDSALKTHHSPYVVDVLDLVDTDDASYVVMELLDMDLGEYLKKYGRLNEENFDTLVKCLAEGYAVLHKHGVVHRDIKPQNILLKLKPDIRITLDSSDSDSDSKNAAVDPDSMLRRQPKIQVAKICDFGCSRDSKDVLTNLVGTFVYMAPEVGACIVDPHLYNEEIDMWSMGVVLYECLQGEEPFTEQDLCKLFLRATNGNYFGYKPPMPKLANEKFKRIIAKLLALDASIRLSPKDFHAFVFDEKENSSPSNDNIVAKQPSDVAMDFKSNIKRTASALFSRMNIFQHVKA